MEWQQILPISLGVQGIAVMVGMAACIVKRVPPTQQAEQIQEHLVQPLGAKHRAMPKFMGRRAAKERADGAVRKQRGEKHGPGFQAPTVVNRGPGQDKQGEMTPCLKPTFQVTAF